ncbi:MULTISPECIES: TIGR03086 family metal-binding protein [unclassified Gordonia (in: high G+C Gram-positive bacteria)]|uniref:TIGR03086 family metal-binding protein n=1 Tax=unclassified Gordonia (in: high G+C Gram-positive bacteria) TaxID=2657482 RepID=UPI001FFF09DE|nr:MULTISPECIES: TIGR03086 family metal-binding protein [unclassified Gordonia (in: high G+C Gram-positive bacteria)]UQE73371.1 TIGR03086 family metal-binding protein [Gordonia sp. PP30]
MNDADRTLDDAEALWAAALSSAGAGTLSAPSGCGEWSNRELIDHVIGGADRYRMLIEGASAGDTAVTRGRDYIGDDPVAAFWRYERALRAAASSADLGLPVDHRAGPRSGTELMTMRVMELTLHAQDLCVGLGIPWAPPERLCEYLLTEAAPVIDGLRGLGLFAAATAPRSATPADRLLAFTGRS